MVGQFSFLSELHRRPNRPNIQKHLLRSILAPAFNRNKSVLRIPVNFVAVSVGDHQTAANFFRNPHRNSESLREQHTPQSLALEAFVYRQTGQQNQRKVVWWKPANRPLCHTLARNAGRRKREIPKHRQRRALIHRNISHANRALLLIDPCVPAQVIVQRFIAAVKVFCPIEFLQAANSDGQITPSSPESALRPVRPVAASPVRPGSPSPLRSSEDRPAANPIQAQPAPAGEKPGSSSLRWRFRS